MELFVNGKNSNYKIVGIYQTLTNYGNIIKMVTENWDEFLFSSSRHLLKDVFGNEHITKYSNGYGLCTTAPAMVQNIIIHSDR